MAKIAMKAVVTMMAMTVMIATMMVMVVRALEIVRPRPERAPALRSTRPRGTGNLLNSGAAATPRQRREGVI